jgi:hypothetical protein
VRSQSNHVDPQKTASELDNNYPEIDDGYHQYLNTLLDLSSLRRYHRPSVLDVSWRSIGWRQEHLEWKISARETLVTPQEESKEEVTPRTNQEV